jgi:hypothetical protein
MLKKEIPTAVPSFNNARLGTHLNEIDAISSHVPVEQISFMMRISNIFINYANYAIYLFHAFLKVLSRTSYRLRYELHANVKICLDFNELF